MCIIVPTSLTVVGVGADVHPIFVDEKCAQPAVRLANHALEQLVHVVAGVAQQQLDEILKMPFDDNEISGKLAEIIRYQNARDGRTTIDNDEENSLQEPKNNGEPSTEKNDH